MKKTPLHNIIKELVRKEIEEIQEATPTKKYPAEVSKLVNDLVSKMHFRKYQLEVGDMYGEYTVELPMTGLTYAQLTTLVDLIPKGSSLGVNKRNSCLLIRTPFSSRGPNEL
jgi:hypothetical protein